MLWLDSLQLEVFCSFIKKEFGLNYSVYRQDFIKNRLEPLVQKYGIKSISEIPQKCGKDIAFKRSLLDALTTNETHFFRHAKHFEILKNYVLPRLIAFGKESGNKRIKVWSAGCSVGAELYSILFSLLEGSELTAGYSLQLTGSDISASAVRRAQKGIYSAQELKGISPSRLDAYFTRLSADEWQIKSAYAKRAYFETFNLLDNWPSRSFNIIFCRNTMMYFGENDQNKLADRFAKALEPNGFLFTGVGEMLFNCEEIGLTKLFLDGEIVYQKAAYQPKMCLITFSTPSDLLRAMNILKNNCFYFELAQNTESGLNSGCKRAISIREDDTASVRRLFSYGSVRVLAVQILKKSFRS